MNSLIPRLYVSAFVNSFGSWLTFLAIALVVKDGHGASHVAFVFLAQTLPSIFFSRALSDLVPERRQGQIYLVLQLLLAANSVLLCFSQSLALIYFHLVFGAFLKAVSTPLFNALVVRFTPRENLQTVFTRLGALQAGTLALAPALGAWIKINATVEILFALDAATFLMAALVLPELMRSIVTQKVQDFRGVKVFNRFLRAPENIPGSTVNALRLWLLFLGIGALINAIEFPAFERLSMSDQQIGFAMAAWGLGAIVSLIWPLKLNEFTLSLVYLAALLGFVVAPIPWAVIASFGAGGLLSSYLSGALRARLQLSVPKEFNPLPLWAYANQLTQLLNLIAYVSVGALLSFLGFGLFAGVMIVCGLWLCLASYEGANQPDEKMLL